MMSSSDRERHRERVRRELTAALFVLDYDPEVAMVKTGLAIMRFAEWLDLDGVERTIREMTSVEVVR